MGEGLVREFGLDMYTLLYLKWKISKDLLYSTENSAQYHVAAWMGRGLWERMDLRIMAESFCSSTEAITMWLIGYLLLLLFSH